MDEDVVNHADHERQVVRLWRAWRTAHEMVQDRGYELTEEEVQMPLNYFRMNFTNPNGSVNYSKLQFSARPTEEMLKKYTPPPTSSNPSPDPECGTIWIEFCQDSGNIGIATIKKFVQHCAANSFRAGIFISASPLSPQARKVIGVTQNYTAIECFLEEEMLVNITHHELVPRHVLLSKEEKIALLKRYRLKDTQLPRIQQKDPVARYLGLRKGQVVKIIRNSETAGRYASYRLCV